MTNTCILQIEDDENDIFFLQNAFQQAAITNPLHVVTRGEEAIDYLSGAGPYADRRKHPLPGLVLLDLKLPGMSGLEVLRWMRARPEFRRVVVIVFTSSQDAKEVALAYEIGANSFIAKPTGVPQRLELAQLLKRWWLGLNQYAPLS